MINWIKAFIIVSGCISAIVGYIWLAVLYPQTVLDTTVITVLSVIALIIFIIAIICVKEWLDGE